jgi:hypothetical protein
VEKVVLQTSSKTDLNKLAGATIQLLTEGKEVVIKSMLNELPTKGLKLYVEAVVPYFGKDNVDFVHSFEDGKPFGLECFIETMSIKKISA